MATRGGKRAGAGRKSKAEELGLTALLDRCWNEDAREKVVKNLAKIASGKDAKAAVSAATLLLGYAYGKPTERHEHSNPDGSPLLQPVAEAMVKVYGSRGSQ